MPIDLDELRRLHATAAESWTAFESSPLPSDQSCRGSSKWLCVRERIDKIGDALAGRCDLETLDFIDHLSDLRGLYWDTPQTPTEQRGLNDAADLFLRVHAVLRNQNSQGISAQVPTKQ